MFIGEGPGYYEDRDGRPFIGQAGKLLDEMLAKIGLERQDVYVTNMVKCRPPNNRDPLPEELSACAPYLDKQIEIISPRVIVCLGRFSFSKFFPGETISKARGRPRNWNGIKVYPMYHPAAALHNPKLKPAIEKDFRNLPALIEQVNQATQNAPEPEQTQARQLSMFE
jgi:DNA polymerase